MGAGLLATGLLSACVPYPVYKTLQPEARLTVVSAAGAPIRNAEVTLIAKAYPAIGEQGRQTKMTGPDGIASFASRREWRVEVLALHGALAFYWNWCVRKEGYVTYLSTLDSSEEFDGDIVIELSPGNSTPCSLLD